MRTVTATSRYAARTTVPVVQSRNEIEKMLRRHGATAFGYLYQDGAEILVFEVARRRVLMRLPLPDRNSREFTHTTTHRSRTRVQADQVYDQAVRVAWRALVLIIKAKLEAIAAGITTVEREFLADIALPNGQTVGDFVAPQLDRVYESGDMPALLPGGSA